MNKQTDQLSYNDEARHDCFVLASMMEIYCLDKHLNQLPLTTPGAKAKIYEAYQHQIKLCPECQTHLAYGELRRALCLHQEDKPNCKDCTTHCYRPQEAEFQRIIMAYGGKRFILYPHLWKDGVKHIYLGIRYLLRKISRRKKPPKNS